MIKLSDLDTRYLFAIWDVCRTYDLANAYAWGKSTPRTQAEITAYCDTLMTETEIQDFYQSFIGAMA